MFDLFHIVHFFFFFFFFFYPKALTGWKILKMEKLKTTTGNLFNHTQDPWDVSYQLWMCFKLVKFFSIFHPVNAFGWKKIFFFRNIWLVGFRNCFPDVSRSIEALVASFFDQKQQRVASSSYNRSGKETFPLCVFFFFFFYLQSCVYVIVLHQLVQQIAFFFDLQHTILTSWDSTSVGNPFPFIIPAQQVHELEDAIERRRTIAVKFPWLARCGAILRTTN